MSKLRTTIAVLSVIAAAGLMTACSDGPRANIQDSTAPAAAAPEQQEPAQDNKLDAEMAAWLDANSKINEMANTNSYGSDRCSDEDFQTMASVDSHAERINNRGTHDSAFGANLNEVAYQIQKSGNAFCAVNKIKTITGDSVTNYLSEKDISGNDRTDAEKARVSSIANKLYPIFQNKKTVIRSLEEAESIAELSQKKEELLSSIESTMERVDLGINSIEGKLACDSTPDGNQCSETAKTALSVVRVSKEFKASSSNMITDMNEGKSSATVAGVSAQVEILERINSSASTHMKALDYQLRRIVQEIENNGKTEVPEEEKTSSDTGAETTKNPHTA